MELSRKSSYSKNRTIEEYRFTLDSVILIDRFINEIMTHIEEYRLVTISPNTLLQAREFIKAMLSQVINNVMEYDGRLRNYYLLKIIDELYDYYIEDHSPYFEQVKMDELSENDIEVCVYLFRRYIHPDNPSSQNVIIEICDYISESCINKLPTLDKYTGIKYYITIEDSANNAFPVYPISVTVVTISLTGNMLTLDITDTVLYYFNNIVNNTSIDISDVYIRDMCENLLKIIYDFGLNLRVYGSKDSLYNYISERMIYFSTEHGQLVYETVIKHNSVFEYIINSGEEASKSYYDISTNKEPVILTSKLSLSKGYRNCICVIYENNLCDSLSY